MNYLVYQYNLPSYQNLMLVSSEYPVQKSFFKCQKQTKWEESCVTHIITAVQVFMDDKLIRTNLQICNPYVYIYERGKYTYCINLISVEWLKTKKLIQKAYKRLSALSPFSLKQAVELCGHSLISTLVKEKIIIPLVERKNIDIYARACLKKNFDTLPDDLNITIIPTQSCNLNCPYCMANNFKNVRANRIDAKKLANIEKTLLIITQANGASKKIDAITLYGGEPLLISHEILESLFRLCERFNTKIRIPTNGTLIQYHLPIIKKYQEFIDFIQITIDGPPSIHNARRTGPGFTETFPKTIEVIDLLLQAGVKTVLRINIDKQNIDHLAELYEIFKRKGYFHRENLFWSIMETFCTDFKLIPPYYFVSKTDMLFNIMEQKMPASFKILLIRAAVASIWGKKILQTKNAKFIPELKRCSAVAGNRYVFSPDGNIYNCEMLLGEELFKIGQYYPSISLNSDRIESIRNTFVKGLSKCMDCKLHFICSGGCPAIGYMTEKRIESTHCNLSLQAIQQYISLAEYVTKH